MLVDTHAHLDYPALNEGPGGLEAVFKRAADQGISSVVAVATSLDSARRCIEIACHPDASIQIAATSGIHPTDDTIPDAAREIENTRATLRALATCGTVVALGETGLDHFRLPKDPQKSAPLKAMQEALFRLHLDLAAETGLPVVVHQRACWEDTIRVLLDYQGRVRCVLHCFAGTLSQARQVIDMGHLVSFTGIVTFPNAADILAVAAALSPGQFMLETDAPYLAPVPHRGQTCEPGHVRLTAEKIAASRQEPLDTLAAHTTETARQFFALR